jgi:hypothetical protein
MRYGTDGNYKVGTGQECCDLPTCCDCNNAACECEVTVTYAGITFPADGLLRTICIKENGVHGCPFIPVWATMGSVKASVVCNTFTGEMIVELVNKWSVIDKVNNAFPAVGDVCDNWIGTGSCEASAVFRLYAWKVCNDCACPDPGIPPKFVDGNANNIPGNWDCVAEFRTDTRTEPTFEIDCGPCP